MSGLPEGWVVKRIGDVLNVARGGSPRPIKSFLTDDPSGLNWIKISDATSGGARIKSTKQKIRSEGLTKSRKVNPGDFLLSNSMSFGKPYITEIEGCIHDGWLVLSDEAKIYDAEFLYYCLLAEPTQQQFDAKAAGTTVRNLNSDLVREVEIPLPPIAEQRRIVEKLDQLSARTRAAKDHLAHVQTLATRAKQATLAAAFRGELTDDWRATATAVLPPITPREVKRRKGKVQDAPFEAPFAIPSDWRWLRLPELGDLDRGKSKHRPRNDPALYGAEYPFVQTGDVRAADRYLSEFSKSYSEFGLAQSRLWPLGTVCITIAANIAETAILGMEACFPDSVVGFSADQECTSPEYVEYFVRTVRDELSAYAPATAQKNINLETLYGVRVPTPPLAEQSEIVRRIETAFARIDRMVSEATRAAELLERLEAQLLAKAFRGELVPQDPADEPASALLDRIREARASAPKPKRTRKRANA